jgi:hypothetical protein
MDDSLEARSQLVAEKCVSLGQGVRRIVAGNAGLMTLEAHLIKLAREDRASERDGLWRPTQP